MTSPNGTLGWKPIQENEDGNRYMDSKVNGFVNSKVTKRSIARQTWGKELEFVLACIGNAVGLGNLWRFPYLCYESGGGAFLIPYFIMLIICGIPLLYMEYAMGQYTRKGPVGALQILVPFFQGAGMATVVLSFLLCTYYNVILSWALYFLFSCFSTVLPWATCNNWWNSPNCFDPYAPNATYDANMTSRMSEETMSPTREFFENKLLQKTSGLGDMGHIRLELLGLLFLSWCAVYFCLWRGIRWTGKVVYFTATSPYLILIIIIIRGVTLPGARLGLDFFLNPRWELLRQPKVWVNAAAQNFNSIGIAFGSMIAFSSYNRRDTPILRDVMAVCCVNSLTSLLAGLAVFSVLGNIAYTQGTDVRNVTVGGPGLVFMIYPQVFVNMPSGLGQFFSVLFFFMIVCLAIDSQFASVEVVVTTIEDHFGPFFKSVLVKKREFLVLIVCIVAFVAGVPVVYQGGIFYFKIIDSYSSGISLMLIALVEVIAVSYFYGAKNLARNVEQITGKKPHLYFVICWYVLSPLLIGGIMIYNWIEYEPIKLGPYTYPTWGIAIGWCLASLSLLCLPIGAVNALRSSPAGSPLKRLKWTFASHTEDIEAEEEQTSEAGTELISKTNPIS